jgi:NADH pyrophosphatase NudC (nudix superfamily)
LKYHNFDKIGDVLSSVAKQSGMNFGISQIALFSLWAEVVGVRFKKNTKAIKINGKTLTIATKSSTVTQELSMFKADILKKLENMTKNLDIKIDEIIFNHKIWNEINKASEKTEETQYRKYLPAPSDFEVEQIEIPQNIKEEIEKSFKNTQNLSEDVKEKIVKTVINDIKRQIWRKERNYPVCSKCFVPMDYIEEGQELLCPVCKS